VFHYGDSLSAEQANYDGNYPYGDAPKGKYLQRTEVVGSYEPNDWGLYDMHGNVWEWCDSWYSESIAETNRANYVGSARVLRGGSWVFNASLCRSARRYFRLPTYSHYDGGFRVARARKS
jgi:formylglycine-generating enzyme required for sulfatase activity